MGEERNRPHKQFASLITGVIIPLHLKTRCRLCKPVRIAQDLRTEQNEVFLDVNAQVLLMQSGEENPFVSLCREADIPLEVWTVDTREEAASLDPYISGITTNCLR